MTRLRTKKANEIANVILFQFSDSCLSAFLHEMLVALFCATLAAVQGAEARVRCHKVLVNL
jgi:hypothetical protein